MFEKLLKKLASTRSTDEERFASLMVLTKVMSPDNVAQITQLHAQVGTGFIDRLLKTRMFY